jgi:hypothetical protein
VAFYATTQKSCGVVAFCMEVKYNCRGAVMELYR